MGKTKRNHKQGSERSDRYIFFLTGIHNLIFVDISLAGMPLRTLLLLLTDFMCIVAYLRKRRLTLPYWKRSSVYEKTMTVLLTASVVLLLVSALVGSDFFWMIVDLVTLLLIYPCIYGRKKFPQDIFGVYSVCSIITCIMLICYYLTGGICEPFVALLLKDNVVVSWLLLSITINVIAYCFQEKRQIWYGINILLTTFLLAIQKNIPSMVIVGLLPLMLPIFCRPSKSLIRRAAQAEAMYAFLVCNMSLITGYTPFMKDIVAYDLEISVYLELLLAAMGVWFLQYWDKYVEGMDESATISEMREWCWKAVTACLIAGTGALIVSGFFAADKTSDLQRISQVVIDDLRTNMKLSSGLFKQMGQRFGIPGIAMACLWFYANIMWIRRTKEWHVRAHKLYRFITVVFLLQAVFLPQTMATLPVYTVFFFLFMGVEEKQRQKIKRNTENPQPKMIMEEELQNIVLEETKETQNTDVEEIKQLQNIDVEEIEQLQSTVPEETKETQNTDVEETEQPQNIVLEKTEEMQNTISEEMEQPQNTVVEETEQSQNIVPEETQNTVSEEVKQPQKEVSDHEAEEKECNGTDGDTAEQVKGENANEINHSNSVLQRGGDAGNRSKRSSKKAGRHRSNRISDHQ